MARLFIGRRSAGGGGCVKVMADNADDPNTTPNTDYGKFLFNSETQDIGYIVNIFKVTFNTSGWPSGAVAYRPSGTNNNTFEYAVYTYSTGNSQDYYYSTERYYKLGFTPLIEVRDWLALGSKRNGPTVKYSDDDTYGASSWCGRVSGSGLYRTNLTGSTIVPPNITLDPGSGHLHAFSVGTAAASVIITAWDLPATNVPVPWTAGTAVAGQKNVDISPLGVKVTRPGFSTLMASDREFIINSDRVPAKIIGTGEIAINAGANVTVPSRFTLTDTTYVDYLVRRSSDPMTFPAFAGNLTKAENINLRYAVFADRVVFYNEGNINVAVRYMICAGDDDVPSSGGSRVMLRGNDGVGDFVQLKRPGSSDVAPRLNDILLDTRLSYITILAEGYLPASAFTESAASSYGNNRKTISFDPKGFFPFVKYVSHHSDGSIRAPVFHQLLASSSSGFNGRPTNESSVAVMNSDNVQFFISPGNPTNFSFNQTNGTLLTNTVSGRTVTGIRYYIFGIPTSL